MSRPRRSRSFGDGEGDSDGDGGEWLAGGMRLFSGKGMCADMEKMAGMAAWEGMAGDGDGDGGGTAIDGAGGGGGGGGGCQKKEAAD